MKRAASLALADEINGESSKRLATEMKQLQLVDHPEHSYDEESYMQGVEAKGFEFVDSLALDDDAEEIEIAPSFLRIPRVILDESTKPFYEKSSQALIPYQPVQKSDEIKDDMNVD